MARNLWRIRQPLVPLYRTASVLLLGAALGCAAGSADPETGVGGSYEDRLSATAKEFAYYELLDENLAKSRWERVGVSLRVPRPFQFESTPVRKSLAEEHTPSRELLGELLPGVLGMWQAVLPGKDGAAPQSAYLFVLSNHDLLSRSPDSAMTFHQTLVEQVLSKLPGLKRLPIESDWRIETWTGHGLPYTWASFSATIAKTNLPADFTMFLMHNGKNDRRDEIKAAMLFVVPKAAELKGSRPDVDPMKLSAETLLIQPPKAEGP